MGHATYDGAGRPQQNSHLAIQRYIEFASVGRLGRPHQLSILVEEK